MQTSGKAQVIIDLIVLLQGTSNYLLANANVASSAQQLKEARGIVRAATKERRPMTWTGGPHSPA